MPVVRITKHGKLMMETKLKKKSFVGGGGGWIPNRRGGLLPLTDMDEGVQIRCGPLDPESSTLIVKRPRLPFASRSMTEIIRARAC